MCRDCQRNELFVVKVKKKQKRKKTLHGAIIRECSASHIFKLTARLFDVTLHLRVLLATPASLTTAAVFGTATPFRQRRSGRLRELIVSAAQMFLFSLRRGRSLSTGGGSLCCARGQRHAPALVDTETASGLARPAKSPFHGYAARWLSDTLRELQYWRKLAKGWQRKHTAQRKHAAQRNAPRNQRPAALFRCLFKNSSARAP